MGRLKVGCNGHRAASLKGEYGESRCFQKVEHVRRVVLVALQQLPEDLEINRAASFQHLRRTAQHWKLVALHVDLQQIEGGRDELIERFHLNSDAAVAHDVVPIITGRIAHHKRTRLRSNGAMDSRDVSASIERDVLAKERDRARMRLDRIHLAFRPDCLRCDERQGTDVGPDIDVRIAGTKQRLDRAFVLYPLLRVRPVRRRENRRRKV